MDSENEFQNPYMWSEAASVALPPARKPGHGRLHLLALPCSLVAVAVLAAIIAVAVGAPPSPRAVLRAAIHRAFKEGTAQVQYTRVDATDVLSDTTTGSGVIDFGRDSIDLTATADVDDNAPNVEVRNLHGTIFLSTPDIDPAKPRIAWVMITPDDLYDRPGSGAPATPAIDVAVEGLGILDRSDAVVTALGRFTVGATEVRGFGFTLPAAGVQELRADSRVPEALRSYLTLMDVSGLSGAVYVDGRGQMRREVVTVDRGTTDTSSVTQTLDFSRFGTTAEIVAPPAAITIAEKEFLEDQASARTASPAIDPDSGG